MRVPSHKEGGFTLIELLVVISIISILASVILVSLNGARAKADNVKTLNNISEYIKALELSRSADGQYVRPVNKNSSGYTCIGTGYPGGTCWQDGLNTPEDSYMTSVLTQYLPTLPTETEMKYMTFGTLSIGYNGYIYRCQNTPNGRCDNFTISWLYKGNVPEICKLSGLKSAFALYAGGYTNCSGWYPDDPVGDVP